jgi:hypothetical protein
MQACANVSEAHLIWLRCEWRGRRGVDDNQWVGYWKVVGPSGLEVVGCGCGP